MNPLRPLIAVLLLACLTVGCGSTYAQLMTAKASYAASVNSLADLNDQGYIDPARYKEIEEVRKEARAALDTLIGKFVRDEQIQWTDAWATFQAAALRLARHQAAVEQAKAAGFRPVVPPRQTAPARPAPRPATRRAA